MYRPDLDEGWFKLSYGMLPILLAARLRLDAAVVLCEILAQVYGKAKRPHATLDVPAIAGRWGMQRPNVWRGLADLKAAKVAVEVNGESNQVKFSKAAMLAILPRNIAQGVANFPMLVKSYERPEGPNSTVSTVDTASEIADDLTVSTVDTQTVSTVDTQTVSTVDTQTVSTVDTVLVPPRTPIRKEIEIERVVVDAGEEGTGPVSVSDSGSKPTPTPKLDLPELRRWAEELIPMEGSGSKIAGWVGVYPLDWIRDAIVCGHLSAPGKAWQYANACLMRWKDRGSPLPADREAVRRFDAGKPSAVPAPAMNRAEAKRAAWRAENERIDAAERAERERSHAG